ncbi:methylated-DNA--[protein]-cysteine S-methyltransferase [Variovorax sp. HJSM1_2]|uniref:methylated-DNA--[protein]-cysteine S-methyltransferase n=1 Tax=Variovorax sp. HJSM1_2 TaxID=3366263 RepID=UPI003BD00AF3
MNYSPNTVRTSWLSPLGPMTFAASEKGLCGVWFDGQRHEPDLNQWPLVPLESHPVLVQTRDALVAYFAGTSARFDVPLDLGGGTPFQQAVWQALLQIPAGATTSYRALSQHIGRPKAVRAVGAAIGRNPISVVVPCHRVVGSSGDLTGYAGGVERKAWLLQRENAPLATQPHVSHKTRKTQ